MDDLPDIRDGLTRLERIILCELDRLREENDGEMVSTIMLYGRVVEVVSVSKQTFRASLTGLMGADRLDADDVAGEL